MRLIWGMLLLGALLFALPARADAIYDVTGTATITGSNACNGPCIEVMNFSLQLDQPDPFTTDVLPGGTFTTSGPIPFGSGSISTGPLDDEVGGTRLDYSPPGGFGADELDLNLGCGGSSPFPCTPRLGPVYLFSCGDEACVADFCPVFCANGNTFSNGGVAGGTVIGTVTLEPPSIPTPEPGEASLLIVGIGLLGLSGWTSTLIGTPSLPRY